MLCYCWDPASQGRSLPLRHWLQTIKSPAPCLDSVQSLFFPPLSPSVSLSELINTQASILQKRHFAITAVLFVFWAAGLQVIPRPSDIRWQTSVPLTLQSLQFSKVIYGMRTTHSPCLLFSAFMMLALHTYASALPCLVSMALSL